MAQYEMLPCGLYITTLVHREATAPSFCISFLPSVKVDYGLMFLS